MKRRRSPVPCARTALFLRQQRLDDDDDDSRVGVRARVSVSPRKKFLALDCLGRVA